MLHQKVYQDEHCSTLNNKFDNYYFYPGTINCYITELIKYFSLEHEHRRYDRHDYDDDDDDDDDEEEDDYDRHERHHGPKCKMHY